MPQTAKPASEPATLDSVFKSMRHWRTHKSEYASAGIPDKIWLMVFELERQGYSGSELRRLFGLNTNQFSSKKSALSGNRAVESQAATVKVQNKKSKGVEPSFCKAVVDQCQTNSTPSLTEASTHPKITVTKLSSSNDKVETYLDVTTIIVECFRPDGHRLQIHTTNKSIDKVMQAFFQYGVHYND